MGRYMQFCIYGWILWLCVCQRGAAIGTLKGEAFDAPIGAARSLGKFRPRLGADGTDMRWPHSSCHSGAKWGMSRSQKRTPRRER